MNINIFHENDDKLIIKKHIIGIVTNKKVFLSIFTFVLRKYTDADR